MASVRADDAAAIDALRINQLQYIGSHNSYHLRPTPSKTVREWNYTHAPLEVQLDRGVRSFELDLHYRDGQFEVFHVPLLDEGTSCRKLADGLAAVRKWSDAHPRHVPISFLFELKSEGPRLDKRIQYVDEAGLDQLDQLLSAAFPPERVISPDTVRGGTTTLREAIHSVGWPTLAASRGKVLFVLHDEGKQRELYEANHPQLKGRVMFVRSNDARDDAATLILDNPRDPKIPDMARAGYFIRTRADADLLRDPAKETARRDTAFTSGAQILSTDFPPGEPDEGDGYTVAFPDHAPARVNVINGPENLRGKAVSE